jgi:hypothetical protein
MQLATRLHFDTRPVSSAPGIWDIWQLILALKHVVKEDEHRGVEEVRPAVRQDLDVDVTHRYTAIVDPARNILRHCCWSAESCSPDAVVVTTKGDKVLIASIRRQQALAVVLPHKCVLGSMTWRANRQQPCTRYAPSMTPAHAVLYLIGRTELWKSS